MEIRNTVMEESVNSSKLTTNVLKLGVSFFRKKRLFKTSILTTLGILLFCTMVFGQDIPPASANNRTIPSGSLIIAMDNTNQALTPPFNVKAYGLVNALLRNKVPVMWSIKAGKTKDAVDFTVSASRVYPTAAGNSTYNFSGGPFIIHRDFVANAGAVISSFGNNVAVYRTNQNVSADIRYFLSFIPDIAIEEKNKDKHTNLLDFVSISNYIVIKADDFTSNSCKTIFTLPKTTSTGPIPVVKAFVQSGGNILGQSDTVKTYESDPAGLFMTTNGVVQDNINTPFTYPNGDMPFSQFIGALEPDPGGTKDWSLVAGSTLKNGAHYVATNSGVHTDKHAAMAAKLVSSGPGGMVFYLGGDDYKVGGTNIEEINGQRMILNTMFVPSSRPGCGINFPSVAGYKSVKVTNDATNDGIPSYGDTLTWTINYSNAGSADATNFQVIDTLPSGLTLQNVTVSTSGPGTTASANPSYAGTSGANSLLNSGAVLGVDGVITIKIEALVNTGYVGTLANQANATGTNLPVGGIFTDNVDNLSTGLIGNFTVPANSHLQTKNDTSVDPTTISISAPTAIKLAGFEVYTDGNISTVEWITGEEVNNLGFNLYREIDGRRELVNQSLIAGSFLKASVNLAVNGQNYFWVDDNARKDVVYYLEDMDLSGKTTLHGPFIPKFRKLNNKNKKSSASIADLNEKTNVFEQKEFVRSSLDSYFAVADSSNLYSTKHENYQIQQKIAAQRGVKLLVDHDAWYRVSAKSLSEHKFDLDTNRNNWRLFTGGEEIPFKVNSDGSIEFFGRGLDLPHSDTRVYYLINGDSRGLRIKEYKAGSVVKDSFAENYWLTAVRKERKTYISSILNGDKENWFGSLISKSGQTDEELNVTKLDNNNSLQALLTLKIQGLTGGGHSIDVTLNGFSLGVVDLSDKENRSFEFNLPVSLVLEGTNTISLKSVGTGNDLSLVDEISLTYPRRFEAVDSKLRFSIPAGNAVKLNGFDAYDNINFFEMDREGKIIKRIISKKDSSDGSYSIAAASYEREMLALPDSFGESVKLVKQNTPSSLNDSRNAADFIIITPEIFKSYANSLAEIREAGGLRTQVVTIEDIYDEFDFGINSPDSIKRFLKNAVSNWDEKPGYVLLFGDSTLDPKNYLQQTDLNLIPAKLIDTQFMETSSDSWLADFDNDGVEDIAIGRLPAANISEAEVMLEKTVRYADQAKSRNRRNVLISDRGFEGYSSQLSEKIPERVEVSQIRRSSMTDAEMRNAIIQTLNNDPQIITYTGHGSTGLWASPNVFTLYDAAGISNEKLSLYLLMTCNNGFTSSPYNQSMAEMLLKGGKGGAALVWASSGTTYSNAQLQMSLKATEMIYENFSKKLRIGDIVITAKHSTTDMDVRRTWQLIGDPTSIVK